MSTGQSEVSKPPARVDSGENNPEDKLPDMDTQDDRAIVYYNRERLGMKNFDAEVRAPMDVEQFAHQAELLLDSSCVSVDEIVDSMIEKVVENEQLPLADKIGEARKAIFVGGTDLLMAHTIQGVMSARLKHNQTWLCAMCRLANLSRRHTVVARFKQPVDMGENAHCVRLFVLIVAPLNERVTKGIVETGRTFATMLADSQFRQKLLNAHDETEFKALMVFKAHRMARNQVLKNRHKYMLDSAVQHHVAQLLEQTEAPTDKSDSVLMRKLTSSPDNLKDFDNQFRRNSHTSKLFELFNQQQYSVEMNPKHECYSNGWSSTETPEKNCTNHKKAVSSSGCCGALFSDFGQGFWQDLSRRFKLYPSDFKDAFVGPPRTVQKTIATIWFLYFGILLPTIAFSSLNTTQTHGHMGDLRKALVGQAIGGLGFALFGGQPLVIIMTTAPLCLYTQVIHQMCLDYGFHFPAMYAAVGLWNGFFLIIYSLFGFSKLMKWCTRSTEEIFAMFIVIAFIKDALEGMSKNFHRFYYTKACELLNNAASLANMAANQSHNHTHQINLTEHYAKLVPPPGVLVPNDTISEFAGVDSAESRHHAATHVGQFEASVCRRETSLLFVLLMLGTLWVGITLYKFRRTPYLSPGKRDLLADYALPAAVILMSYVGSYIFSEIYDQTLPPGSKIHLDRAPVELLPLSGILTSAALGFTLSVLFFMDQNISAAMVTAPQNQLKKGSAYHYDLFVIAILNAFLTMFGFPMMHGVLPHSPLHARSLSDIEEHVEEGHVYERLTNCRENRVTALVSHVLIMFSILLIPYPIAYIPRAVLDGLFLYMAVTSLDGLQIFDRLLLLITEQKKYPPNHFTRRCPQSKIHMFTLLQICQLIVFCLFGFSPINIVEMFFPVLILLMIPFRHKIVPKFIEQKYLDSLDKVH